MPSGSASGSEPWAETVPMDMEAMQSMSIARRGADIERPHSMTTAVP